MTKTIKLTVNTEHSVELVGDGTHVRIENRRDGTVYASKYPGVVAGADNVMAIDGGVTKILTDVCTYGIQDSVGAYRGTVYLLADTDTSVEITTTNNANFKLMSKGGDILKIDWNNVTNKPTEFPPSTHTHSLADIQFEIQVGDWTVVNKNIIDTSEYANNTKIQKVALTSTNTINAYAFNNCLNLQELTIPDSVIYIGNNVCYNCENLTKVTMPTTLPNLEAMLFYGCVNLQEITVPNGVEHIHHNAFGKCSSLQSINIPISCKYIHNDAFVSCKNLTDVYYEGTEEQWNEITFGIDNGYLLNANIHYNYTFAQDIATTFNEGENHGSVN